MNLSIIVQLIILLFSAILHEIAHGAVAEYFGDDTAREAGRITINPINHIDPVYTLLIPLMMVVYRAPIIFGAAKPVPVNYNRLNNFRWGVFWVSIAGILTNIFLAVFFALCIKFISLNPAVQSVFAQIVLINIMLAIINLIPIPPIDGSKVLASLFGEGAIEWVMRLEMRGIWGLLPFIVLVYFVLLSPQFQAFVFSILNWMFSFLGI